MTRKETLEMAREIRDSLANFNDVNDEIGYDLYSFELNGSELNVFAYIRKEKDQNHKWYAIYAGVEYEGGNNIYADYDNSTEHLRVCELADVLYHLANMYKQEKYLKELQKMMGEGS